ncbi:MAG: hypothetical protein EPN47_10070 [Acidobacteria bacterium]|nr:MAG: hypothetical protein EPN47_10070 [Acidobacteriota bacterium]
MPLYVYVWLLHAWRDVLHDGEGGSDADGTSIHGDLGLQPSPAGSGLLLLIVAAGDGIDSGLTRRPVF